MSEREKGENLPRESSAVPECLPQKRRASLLRCALQRVSSGSWKGLFSKNRVLFFLFPFFGFRFQVSGSAVRVLGFGFRVEAHLDLF